MNKIEWEGFIIILLLLLFLLSPVPPRQDCIWHFLLYILFTDGSITPQVTLSNTPNLTMSGQARKGFGRGPPLGIKVFQKILPSTSMIRKNIW